MYVLCVCVCVILSFLFSFLKVEQGVECGLTLQKFKEFEEGDMVECLSVTWRAKVLLIEKGESGALSTISASSSSSGKGEDRGSKSDGAGGGKAKKEEGKKRRTEKKTSNRNN